ncbi:periodic tryptophan 2 homolog [Pelobates cultripes]|uniref:Periodic tryptophan 2 homolog n=1 Tax=Pelobates cultripes TaxID=61616 RepID=A0AAD1VJ40_PELCU|nr:periodic tryptophan 2 homolog [Pelobates cultripes]
MAFSISLTEGAALLVSLVTKSVLNHFHFHQPVHSVRFSPDGRKFVVCKGSVALLYHAPGKKREYNAFVLDKTFYGPYDETSCIDWTDDSKCFAVGSKDMSTWVFGAERWQNLIYYSLGGHKDAITSCFFEENSLDLYTLSVDATLCTWQCDTELAGLIPRHESKKCREMDNTEADEGQNDEVRGLANPSPEEKTGRVQYKKTGRHFFNKEGDFTNLTSAAFHKKLHLLVTGFASGIFHIHEVPELSLIHSLSISDQKISSITINNTGEWIAFGCSGLGQLLVWEWQSESYVLKQQGHFNNMVSLSYSPDGQHIVTGGEDGKVKVWDTNSGFCFVTFTDHTSCITAVTFTTSGQVVLSASLDGTVRAFSLLRYRNFRTFTSPRPTQFSCLAVDGSGDIVCAGAQDSYEVYVWSMQTGKLLDVLAGHTGPISSVAFNPWRSVLATASWDKTVQLWDMADSWRTTETLNLNSDVMAVVFRPDGKELAVASLDGQITFWDPEKGNQSGSIEGRHDLQMGRKELDKVTAKHSSKGKTFTTLCYSADGRALLAGGLSRFVCIYHVEEQILAKKFEISCNHSLDAMERSSPFSFLSFLCNTPAAYAAVPLPFATFCQRSPPFYTSSCSVPLFFLPHPAGISSLLCRSAAFLFFAAPAAFLSSLPLLRSSLLCRLLPRSSFLCRSCRVPLFFAAPAAFLSSLPLLPRSSLLCRSCRVPLFFAAPAAFLSSLPLLPRSSLLCRPCRVPLFFAAPAAFLSSLPLLPRSSVLCRSCRLHCDWNRYNLKFALCLSRQRGAKRAAEESVHDSESDIVS